jgi:hypothetical protein
MSDMFNELNKKTDNVSITLKNDDGYDDGYDFSFHNYKDYKIPDFNPSADEQFNLWLKYNQYGKYGLRGGQDDDLLPEHCCLLIKSIISYSYSLVDSAVALKEMLIDDGLINEEHSYDDVNNNVPLKKLLYNTVRINLPDSALKSSFGFKIVSDYDLVSKEYENNENLKKLLTNLKVDPNSRIYEELMKARAKARRFVANIRDSMILHMKLPDTPTIDDLLEEKNKRRKRLASEKLEQQRAQDKNKKNSMDIEIESINTKELESLNSTGEKNFGPRRIVLSDEDDDDEENEEGNNNVNDNTFLGRASNNSKGSIHL